jgi:hypothetical protein
LPQSSELRINRLPALLGAVLAAGLSVLLPAGPALVGAALAALVALFRTPASLPARTREGAEGADGAETAGQAMEAEKAVQPVHSDDEVAS